MEYLAAVGAGVDAMVAWCGTKVFAQPARQDQALPAPNDVEANSVMRIVRMAQANPPLLFFVAPALIAAAAFMIVLVLPFYWKALTAGLCWEHRNYDRTMRAWYRQVCNAHRGAASAYRRWIKNLGQLDASLVVKRDFDRARQASGRIDWGPLFRRRSKPPGDGSA